MCIVCIARVWHGVLRVSVRAKSFGEALAPIFIPVVKRRRVGARFAAYDSETLSHHPLPPLRECTAPRQRNNGLEFSSNGTLLNIGAREYRHQ